MEAAFAHPGQSSPLTRNFFVILHKSDQTYFTENFSYTIILIIIILYIDKNVNESTTVCSLRSLRSQLYIYTKLNTTVCSLARYVHKLATLGIFF